MIKLYLILLLLIALLADAFLSLRTLHPQRLARGRKAAAQIDEAGNEGNVLSKHAPIVAIIDTGMDEQHPDLQGALWQNPGEIAGNGVDDDGNGYVDDVSGWNFVMGNSEISDTHGHGTHVAGIIHAAAPSARLMILKYFDTRNTAAQSLVSTVRAIRYAVRMGAKIINFSGGGLEPDAEEKAAIIEAEKQGVLVVAAAGNESRNSDFTPYFPAGYGLSNIISVGAVNIYRRLLNSSNFGIRSVDIAALGEHVVSTLPHGRYGEMTGTSQATAAVAGVAASLLVRRPDLASPKLLRQQLLATSLRVENLVGKARNRSVVDPESAFVMVGPQTSAFGQRIPTSTAEVIIPTGR